MWEIAAEKPLFDVYLKRHAVIYYIAHKIIKKANLLVLRVTGDGFMRNMVRIMVGTLIDVGRGKKTIKEVKEMLNHPNKGTKRNNISPSGLYLINIKY